MRPKVSIIITSYNYARYIGECIASCRRQTFQDIEIVVVDDCSIDESVAVAERLHCKDHRVKLHVLPRNHGYSYAKNYGIRHSFGEYIALIDADDVLTPDSIETRLNAFTDGIDMVHGIALRWYGGRDTRGYNKKTYCHAQGRMYRRRVYELFGLYYEPLRSMSDKEFIYRLGVHPQSPLPRQIHHRRIKRPVALYRKHDAQMHRVRKQHKKMNDEIKKIFKRRIKQLRREGITKDNTEWL